MLLQAGACQASTNNCKTGTIHMAPLIKPTLHRCPPENTCYEILTISSHLKKAGQKAHKALKTLLDKFKKPTKISNIDKELWTTLSSMMYTTLMWLIKKMY